MDPENSTRKSVDLSKLHTNQRLLIEELISRGVEISDIDQSIELLQAQLGDHIELLFDRYSGNVPYNVVTIMADKFLTKHYLRMHWFSTPDGWLFDIGDRESILEYIKKNLKYPLVFKPNRGSHGEWIYMNINALAEVDEIIAQVSEKMGEHFSYVIEEQFEGQEHRIFVTKNGKYAVLHREPASVVGDWKNTLEQLVTIANEQRASINNCLCPIRINKRYITQQWLTHEYIPQQNEKVFVQSISNVAAGWMAINRTRDIHSSYIELAKQVLASFPNTPYLGLDMLIKDRHLPATPNNYSIVECNTNPWIKMHMMPGIGAPENVASYLADIIFPETVKSTSQSVGVRANAVHTKTVS